MCGFAGFLCSTPAAMAVSEDVLRNMGNAIAHRGPDDQGEWQDRMAGFGVSHRRLSIADLSQAGHQPMVSNYGRYVLAFNGEIYNHKQLRASLEEERPALSWRGRSDTEVLLACVESWGFERTLSLVVGMFAFALWDRQHRTLIMARDRMGEKPLYWGWQGDTLLFGSELKALKTHPKFQGEIDRNSLALLLRHNYIPSPYSIYKGIYKLLPGHYIEISSEGKEFVSKPYWDYSEVVRKGMSFPFDGIDALAVDQLESLLASSVASQMIADVPLGAFLSGGVDSSVVVALMQRQSTLRVRTYSIGFKNKALDEAVHARAVARHLGTDHSELYIDESDALAVIPKLPGVYCEPFADSSQIPTFLVSSMARQHVTVALSGDGGDELFGGYTPYQFMPKIWRILQFMPLVLRKSMAAMLSALPLPQRMNKLCAIMGARDREDLYLRLRSHWLRPDTVVLDSHEPESLLSGPSVWRFVDSFERWMMAMDTVGYMPDDILVKVDRAAMANSLETRVPMLDHRVVEFAARLPLHMKIRDGEGKWVLRELLYRYVPRKLVDRPKAGFMVPLGAWLRGPLREWAEELLAESSMRQQGYFDEKKVRAVWLEHLAGRADRSGCLWSVLMFQAWLVAR
ncbi:asparagine synthase (glutamine-hydrolyzing) [Pusillimonas sp. T2]|uniref:asparagine synthase (glutamine-hydrolyzing) n=1 Tax=Pusillimonas sp. T2 TaxID=1548123 RepID=UPI000B9C81C5|nr:asparagine synthase (glutamine-hydrolyzing) [Pusillimonas sp. T2]OXR50247.1 asparagine synthase (glutamine-hydrolyzing) [Pusillimonas sp. T2]